MSEIIIITGFLGSGKTELLKNLLDQNKKSIGVIENEVADFGVDSRISFGENVTVYEIIDGSVSGVNLENLVRVVKKLEHKDLIIIETSGAASLEPIISRLGELRVICVIDAERFSKADKLSSHTLQHVEHASLVLLNKCDLISENQKKKQLKNLRYLNENVVPSVKCKLNIDIKRLRKIKPLEKEKKNIPYILWKIKNNLGITNREIHKNINAITFRSHGRVDTKRLEAICRKYSVRAKGFINSDKYFNFVGNRFIVEKAPREFSINTIVIIGHNVFSNRGRIKNELKKCMSQDVKNQLQDFFYALKNQQNLPQRVRVVR